MQCRQAELIVALDVPTAHDAERLVAQLGDSVSFYKVGLELYTAEGPAFVRRLTAAGKSVFLDLKLHDIPRTVARALAVLADLGVSMATLHTTGGPAMMREAVAGRPDGIKLVGVTALTSLDAEDLAAIGITRTIESQVSAMARLAIDCGLDGLVCSPREAGTLRAALGHDALLVTPGIRPSGSDVGDQKRIATPQMAVESGATHLVVGRPITQAKDPAVAARDILTQMRSHGT